MPRNICFTLNNYSAKEVEDLKKYPCSYCVFGFEIGDNGTPHLQGYMEIANTRFTTLKNRLPRFHIETRKGTAAQAADYCKKGGNFFESGIISMQGCRKDLDRARRLAVTEGMREVTAICNFQQIKTAEKFLTYNEDPRDFKPYVYWFWGATGVGKSKLARELCSDDTYTKNDGTKWWDGYDSHEFTIIDDFRDSWWSLTEMLSLLDRYEKRIEFKGGYRQFKSKVIIVTSSKSPRDYYTSTGEAIEQLIRRVDCIHHVV